MTNLQLNKYIVASHLKMLVSDIEANMTLREFSGWIQYINWENNPEKNDIIDKKTEEEEVVDFFRSRAKKG